MLVPGDRTRGRALVENGRRAMKLIAASTLFLIVAGSLEGMVSPIPNWPLWGKLAVSAATLALMAAYLTGGTHWRRRAPADSVAPRGPESKPLLSLTDATLG
jgi:hypothetical protein